MRRNKDNFRQAYRDAGLFTSSIRLEVEGQRQGEAVQNEIFSMMSQDIQPPATEEEAEQQAWDRLQEDRKLKLATTWKVIRHINHATNISHIDRGLQIEVAMGGGAPEDLGRMLRGFLSETEQLEEQGELDD